MDDTASELVLTHDRDISRISLLVGHLTEAVTVTNQDVKKLLAGMASQAVLVDKMDNLEDNLRESFTRVHNKIRDIDTIQTGDGCKALTGFKSLADERYKVASSRIADLESITRGLAADIVEANTHVVDLAAAHRETCDRRVDLTKEGLATDIKEFTKDLKGYIVKAVLLTMTGISFVTGYLYTADVSMGGEIKAIVHDMREARKTTSYLDENMPLVIEALEAYRKERSISAEPHKGVPHGN